MGLNFYYVEGQTPVDENEKEGLLIKTIHTRKELDEQEQLNIESAIEWTMRRRSIGIPDILNEPFIKDMHRRMFCDVWAWAGTYRKSNKNIGVEWHQIGVNVRNLLDDCMYWIRNKTFSEDEIAIRFKHRLVKIHPFPNGNGRHSRVMADILIYQGFKKDVFTWGGNIISSPGDIRSAYISALMDADGGNYSSLMKFARS